MSVSKLCCVGIETVRPLKNLEFKVFSFFYDIFLFMLKFV